MKAKTNTDYYNIMLEGCKEAFENIELKEYFYTGEAMTDFNEVSYSKDFIEQLGIDTVNDLTVNYRTTDKMTHSFLHFLDRQQAIFEKKYLVPRNEFFQRCLNVVNIKLVELNKQEHRILKSISDLGSQPNPLLFMECLKFHLEKRSLQTIDVSKPETIDLNNASTDNENLYLGQPTNENANEFFKFLCEYYRTGDKTQVKYVNILYYLKNDAEKKHFIYKVKQKDYKKLIESKGIIISKFDKSANYLDVEKPIFHTLENTFLKNKTV